MGLGATASHRTGTYLFCTDLRTALRGLGLNQIQPQKHMYNFHEVKFYEGAVRAIEDQSPESQPAGWGQKLPADGACRVSGSHQAQREKGSDG